MEKSKKNEKQAMPRNQMISFVIWIVLILICALYFDETDKKMVYILFAGFFMEFLRITSSYRLPKQENET